MAQWETFDAWHHPTVVCVRYRDAARGFQAVCSRSCLFRRQRPEFVIWRMPVAPMLELSLAATGYVERDQRGPCRGRLPGNWQSKLVANMGSGATLSRLQDWRPLGRQLIYHPVCLVSSC